MGVRWDLKPVFKNAKRDSDMANWTRRSVISSVIAIVAFCVASWNVEIWQFMITAVAIVAAFDAGDMRFPYEDNNED